MATKTVTVTSTSDSNTTYKAQATDSCGNKAAGTWTGTKCSGCAKFVTSTTNDYAVVTIYPADATAGTNNTYTITWSCADKVSTTYTIDVVTNIQQTIEKKCGVNLANNQDGSATISGKNNTTTVSGTLDKGANQTWGEDFVFGPGKNNELRLDYYGSAWCKEASCFTVISLCADLKLGTGPNSAYGNNATYRDQNDGYAIYVNNPQATTASYTLIFLHDDGGQLTFNITFS